MSSVASVKSKLHLESGTAPEMQILLVREADVPVRELHTRIRGQPALLQDHRLLVPLRAGVRVCMFDKSFMQPGGVAPMEKLNRFEYAIVEGESLKSSLARLQKQCELQQGQIDDQLSRQGNRAEACRVAVGFLAHKIEMFRVVVTEFEQKWKTMALHHPTLIASASDDLEKLKTTRVRDELGLRVGRTLWDLYTQNSEPEMILFVRKSQQEHETLTSKVRNCLETSKKVVRDANELLSRNYELLEPLEQAQQRLMKLTKVSLPLLERKLVQEGEGSTIVTRGVEQALAEYELLTSEAETFINNYTLSIQLRLQGVTALSQGVWQQQEQIKGVLGIAVDRLMQRFHALLVVHELPALQNVLADEAVKRATFRNRVAATFRNLENALEPLLVDETNRRAGFLSDKHPFVREFFSARFDWVKDEPLNLHLPTLPGFDRKLPIAASGDRTETSLLLIGSNVAVSGPPQSPAPPSFQSPLPKGKEEMGADAEDELVVAEQKPDAMIAEFVNRIKYLEAQLARRVDRSASELQKIKLDSKRVEEKMSEENSMLKSELSVMEQTLSHYQSSKEDLPSPQESVEQGRKRNVVVLSDFEVGDRVAFHRNEAKQFEVLLNKNVYLSQECCAAFAEMKLPNVFCGVVVSKPEERVATPNDNFFQLPPNTKFVELTVVLDSPE